MTTKAKTIKMLLYDGSLSGVMNINDSAWESGKMYSAPRESINDLIKKGDCKKYGVYLLLSDQQVYVGQASDLERRTKQHLADKDWWTQVVLMTTKDDSFNASDIDYLESRLINIAEKVGKLDSDNKKRGNPQKVDEFRQAELEQYLEEALFLLQLIGIRVFKKEQGRPRKKDDKIPPLPSSSMGPCEYAKTALKNLMESGYNFTDEQMNRYGSIEGSKEFTRRNLPMFWILRAGEKRLDLDKLDRERYWAEEFQSGQYRFLAFSQWYKDGRRGGAHKSDFDNWYKTLSENS